jgi:hypothetical protein
VKYAKVFYGEDNSAAEYLVQMHEDYYKILYFRYPYLATKEKLEWNRWPAPTIRYRVSGATNVKAITEKELFVELL